MNRIAAVAGIGAIGWSVAADLLFYGFEVIALDSDPGALDRGAKEIAKALRFAPMLNKSLPAIDQRAALARLSPTGDPAALSRAELVVENVPEVWPKKAAFYRSAARFFAPDALILSNTSATSITRISSLIDPPGRVAGMHFMNPAHLTPIVEIVRGAHSSDGAIERAKELARSLGKDWILAEDTPGFASNRLSHMLMNEAAYVVHERVTSAEEVDRLFKKGFGHRMGPLETADLIGLDTVVATLDVLHAESGDSKFRCCPLLRRLVDAGFLGRKSGRGFFSYGEGGRE